MQQALLSPSM